MFISELLDIISMLPSLSRSETITFLSALLLNIKACSVQVGGSPPMFWYHATLPSLIEAETTSTRLSPFKSPAKTPVAALALVEIGCVVQVIDGGGPLF